MITDIVLVLVGVVTGCMNAIAGGGMILGFPVLLAVGVPAISANATCNIVVLPAQITSAWGYRRYIRKVPLVYLWLLLPCFIGAIIGANILLHTSSAQFEELIPWLIAAAVLLFAVQPFLHFHFRRQLKRRAPHLPVLAIIGVILLPLSLYGGYFGAGFGFVILAFLGFTSLHDLHQMNGLKNLASVAIAIASLLVLAHGSLIDWHHGLAMAAGSTIGGYGGARMAQRISSRGLRIAVILIGCLTAAYIGLIHH